MFFMFFVVLSIYVDVFLVEHLPIFNATPKRSLLNYPSDVSATFNQKLKSNFAYLKI